tara:strand:+ start:97 stop:327 length:231 start_codon:yes stop_codon:yes gene_type:complete
MKALSLKEAADRLACSVDTVRGNVRAGRIRAVNLALGSSRQKLVIPESEIERILSPAKVTPKKSRRRIKSVTVKRY